MKKIVNFRTAIGLLIIFIALWTPPQEPDIQLINVDKPTQAIIDIVTPISSMITDPTDRAKLAIFNQTFANRIKIYNADLQQVNDIYVLAASCFFENTLVNKYDNLDTKIISLIENVTGPDNKTLTAEDKEKISSNFMGLAWTLIQKR